jgi:DNA ligase (NAD+)
MAYCPNSSCPAQRYEQLKHFVGAMDILGVGEEVVADMLEAGLIEDAGDLYALTAEDLAKLPLFKEKRTANVLDSIERSKERPFAAALFALGIRHVGGTVAELLAEHFPSIDAVMSASEEALAEVEGIGPKIAASVRTHFLLERNRQVVDKLRAAGVTLAGVQAPRQGPLTGKTFVLTGSLPTLPRGEAERLIEDAGGKVASSVSKKVDYLLVGADPGSKLEKARKLRIPEVDEAWLKGILG